MAKFNDLNGLTYYSTKLNNYLKGRFKKLGDDLSLLSTKVTNDKVELAQKIQDNTDDIAINTQDIQDNADAIVTVDDKVDALQNEVNGIGSTTINGDVINVNKVEQYVYTNVHAGDVIEIPNTTGVTDFMIECYTDIGATPEVDHTVLNLNSSTIGSFIYDDRFVEVTATGVKPKDSIQLNYARTEEVVGGITYAYYMSDVIPEELLSNLNSIISIEEA